MTKREAAIVSAYTGYLIGDFSELHKYIEELFGRPVWTHEMGTIEFRDKVRELSKDGFISITVE